VAYAVSLPRARQADLSVLLACSLSGSKCFDRPNRNDVAHGRTMMNRFGVFMDVAYDGWYFSDSQCMVM
jgi:hypothetical protein